MHKPSLEVQTALEAWRATHGRSRTLGQLDELVRHWCTVYGRDDAYTAWAIADARKRAAREVRET